MANYGAQFWQALDELISESEVVIDRPRGPHHPRYALLIYPFDYGYLKDTTSMDSGGIDVWRGTDPAGKLDAVIVTVDLRKRDSEIKLLIGCTEVERQIVYDFHNSGTYMKGLLLLREPAAESNK